MRNEGRKRGNKYAVNAAADAFLEAVKKDFEVTEVYYAPYRTVRIFGLMKFGVHRYDVKGIGSLCVMKLNMGIMQMTTIVLTPVERDIPLVSLDLIYTLSKRKCILEFYDLVLKRDGHYAELTDRLENLKSGCGNLRDMDQTPAWYSGILALGIYKEGTKEDDGTIISLASGAAAAVTEYAGTLPSLTGADRAEKIRLQKTLSNGLIENGGLSTDAFVKSLGAEKTRDFFDRVLFRAV